MLYIYLFWSFPRCKVVHHTKQNFANLKLDLWVGGGEWFQLIEHLTRCQELWYISHTIALNPHTIKFICYHPHFTKSKLNLRASLVLKW